FRVNSFTSGSQSGARVSMDAAGGFAITWQSGNQDGSSGGVYLQRVDQSGNPVGNEFRINSTTISAQTAPAIAMNDVGQFVVSWQSSSQDGDLYGVYVLPFGPTFPNSAPIANAGGPYDFVPGHYLQLNASASTDPDLGQALTYAWDVNGDGVFTD